MSLRWLPCFILLSTACLAQVAPDIAKGTTRAEVIRMLGWPQGTSLADDREILNYPQFSVLLEQGRVLKVEPKPKEEPTRSPVYRQTPPKVSQPAPAPRPVAPASQPKVMTPVPTYQSKAQVAQTLPPPIQLPAAPTPAPSVVQVTRRTDAGMNQLAWVLLALSVGAGLMLTAWVWQRRREEAELKRYRDKANAPRAAKPPEPPVVSPRPVRPDPIKDGWTLALLKGIEWHRYEQVVAEYYRLTGHEAKLTDFGPDGGVDVEVCRPGEAEPCLLVQCKAWDSEPIDVKLVRELYGVTAARRVTRSAFFTTSDYTPSAREFAASVGMELLDGPGFLAKIQSLDLVAQLKLHELATAGDYKTPTCASCGTKMLLRNPGNGIRPFYGCRSFPRCRNKLSCSEAA